MTKLFTEIYNKPITLWTTSGLLSGFAFFVPTLWFLAIGGILFFFDATKKSTSYKEIILGSWLAGSLHFLLVHSWFWSVYPLDWLGVGALGSVALILGVWLTCGVVLGLGRLVFAVYIYSARKNELIVYTGAPFIWLVGELTGSFLFSLYTYGNGGRLSFEFSTGYVGYVLAEHGLLLRFAEYGGVFLLSMLVAGIATGIYFLLTHQVSALRMWGVTGMGVLFFTSFITYSNPYQTDEYTVVALSTDYEAYVRLDQEERLFRQDDLLKTVATVLEADVDYVILPEDARFSSVFDSSDAVFNFINSFSKENVVIVDSTIETLPNGEKGVLAIVYNSKNNTVDKIYKEYLMPTGEYLPYFHSAIIRLAGFTDAADKFSALYDYRPNNNSEIVLRSGTPGVLFCFEAVSSVALKQAANRSTVPFVAHVVSHSWFTNPWLLHRELKQIMTVNTLFAKTTVYQASNQYEAVRF